MFLNVYQLCGPLNFLANWSVLLGKYFYPLPKNHLKCSFYEIYTWLWHRRYNYKNSRLTDKPVFYGHLYYILLLYAVLQFNSSDTLSDAQIKLAHRYTYMHACALKWKHRLPEQLVPVGAVRWIQRCSTQVPVRKGLVSHVGSLGSRQPPAISSPRVQPTCSHQPGGGTKAWLGGLGMLCGAWCQAPCRLCGATSRFASASSPHLTGSYPGNISTQIAIICSSEASLRPAGGWAVSLSSDMLALRHFPDVLTYNIAF